MTRPHLLLLSLSLALVALPFLTSARIVPRSEFISSPELVEVSPGFITYDQLQGKPYKVSYDERSLQINGQPALFLSGTLHYPRSTPGMWREILEKAKGDGLNMIETYVFWNYHYHDSPTQADYSGMGNITQFLDICADVGLFVNFRIGPYVCAEWNYGGFPLWLNDIPNMELRRYNQPFMREMEKFTREIVGRVRNYFADRGGPIVIAQIENEYHGGPAEWPYVEWCGKLAESLDVNVPWEMCNGESAEGTINTCNGNDCTSFIESHWKEYPGTPALWTENEGWFTIWNQQFNESEGIWGNYPSSFPTRTAEDLAFTVARWFARGGSHHNYYMWFGGNNYKAWSGSGLTTAYAPDVNLLSNGLPNEPKKSHMQALHHLMAEYADVLLMNEAQLTHSIPLQWFNNATGRFENGTQQVAFTYISPSNSNRGLTFVENSFTGYIQLLFNGKSLTLPGSSVWIYDLKGNILYKTSDVPSDTVSLRTEQVVIAEYPLTGLKQYAEGVPPLSLSLPSLPGVPSPIYNDRPLEQLSLTKDMSEYMWYFVNLTQSQVSEIERESDGTTSFSIGSIQAQSFIIFINNRPVDVTNEALHSSQLLDHKINVNISLTYPVSISLLSVTLGIDNLIQGTDLAKKGILSSVSIGGVDVTDSVWGHKPRLDGEWLEIYTKEGESKVPWNPSVNGKMGVSWFQTTFPTPPLPHELYPSLSSHITDFAIMIDMSGFTRGHVYINGNDLGKYFITPRKSATQSPTQSLYHCPRDWLNDEGTANRITIFEEMEVVDFNDLAVKVVTVVSKDVASQYGFQPAPVVAATN